MQEIGRLRGGRQAQKAVDLGGGRHKGARFVITGEEGLGGGALGLRPAPGIGAEGLDQSFKSLQPHAHVLALSGARSESAARKARRPRASRLSSASTLTCIAAAASIFESS